MSWAYIWAQVWPNLLGNAAWVPLGYAWHRWVLPKHVAKAVRREQDRNAEARP